jgi:uncharacterized protein YdbL (DUF1318 family)
MKRLALILLALGMNAQAAALTLNDARAQGRVGKPQRVYCPDPTGCRNAGAGKPY